MKKLRLLPILLSLAALGVILYGGLSLVARGSYTGWDVVEVVLFLAIVWLLGLATGLAGSR